MDPSLRDTIARVAQEEGVDPAYALAVAERESSFNPNAHASKTISGLFQMTGKLRQQYGAGDSRDPAVQTRAFGRFTRDLQGEMTKELGRAPTNNELYLGHFWGGPRASRVINGSHAGMSPQDIFSPRELAENPQLARGSSAGGLASTIMADIGRRQAKYNDVAQPGSNPVITGNNRQNSTDFAQFGQPGEPLSLAPPAEDDDRGAPRARGVKVASNGPDFAQFGDGASAAPPIEAVDASATGKPLSLSPPADTDAPDFAAFGEPTKTASDRPGQEIDVSQYGMKLQPVAFKPGRGPADAAQTMPPNLDEWSTFGEKPPKDFQGMTGKSFRPNANRAENNIYIPPESGDRSVITPDALADWGQQQPDPI